MTDFTKFEFFAIGVMGKNYYYGYLMLKFILDIMSFIDTIKKRKRKRE